jgi:hypothetical protein
LELVDFVLKLEGPRNPAFIERIGDALALWRYPEKAVRYYEMALGSPSISQKRKVQERLKKKITTINT